MADFKNMSIKKRLMIILLMWIILFVSFGIFAIKQMNHLGSVTVFIYNNPLQVSNAATEMRVDIIKVQRATKDLLLARNAVEQEAEISKIRALDKMILANLETLDNQDNSEKTIVLRQRIKEKLIEWQVGREQLINHFKVGNIEEATYLTKDEFPKLVDEIEGMLKQVSIDSKEIANQLAKKSETLERKQSFYITIVTVLLCMAFFVIFIATLQSIIDPINKLKNAMKESIHTGKLSLVNEEGENEVIEMSRFYNDLAKKLTDIFWIKDNKNILNEKLSGYYSQKEIAEKTISSLCRTIAAGNGVFYTYDKEDRLLKLAASYAFQQSNQIQAIFSLGEGVIGQVGLEKKALLLTDLIRKESQVYTAIISEKPVNTYVFPIVYEEELYGVIEVATLVPFEKLKLDYLEETSSVIARSLYSSLQNVKIIELFNMSEKSKVEAYKNAEQLEKVNKSLYTQQRVLEQQTEQLRQSNIELEGQHQLLQQQSEELQQTNTQLEEQQQQLEEQARTLNEQNRKLEKAKIDLEISGKYKSDFLANMSHELRTPLNSIILLSKLILASKKETLSLPNQEKLEVIHRSGEELLRLINDVLDLSKVESGAVSKDDNFFHSSQIVQDIKGMFENAAREKSLNLIIKDEVERELYGDERKISQILRNFVSNAIKFTDKGLVKVELKYSPIISSEIIFSVKDSGRGILETQQELIFAQFQQEDNTISRKYGGTGLGLSISKKLAEVLGGYIKVESKTGEGSEFILYVPDLIISENTITPAADNKKEVLDNEEVQHNENLVEAQNIILVIEEDKAFANYIEEVIYNRGFKAIVAETGREGMILAKKYRPKGILLDLELPDISGMEILRQLKSIRELSYIPVHIISAYDINNEPQGIETLVSEMFDLIEENPLEGLLIAGDKIQQSEIQEVIYDIGHESAINKAIDLRDKSVVNLAGKKILIVDDDPRSVYSLAAILEDYNAHIIEAHNGKAALKKLNGEKIDLILMDVIMPEMDGYETIKQIREDNRFKNIPIIVITARSLKGDRDKCIEIGANDYIPKPIDYKNFIKIIGAWISKH